MTNCFSAKLLLWQSWPLDIQAIAEAAANLVPSIDAVEGIKGQSDHQDAAVLRLDDTQVVIQVIHRPVRPHSMIGNAEAFDSWAPQDLLDSHQSYISVSCGGERIDIGSMELYAAAVHVTATALCSVSSAGAVFWDSAEILVHPNDFRAAIGPMMAGQMPISTWVGFRPIWGEDKETKDTVGMITCGLRQFLGREIELAPSTTTLERARICLGSVVQRLMDQRQTLHDGDVVENLDMALKATVRLRDRWIRRDKSAFVLVTEDAAADRANLRPDKRNAA